MLSLKVAHRILFGSLLTVVLVAALGWLAVVTSGWQLNRLQDLRASALEMSTHAAGMATTARSAQTAVQSILVERTTQALAASAEVTPGARAAEQAGRRSVEEALGAFDRHRARSAELAQEDSRAAAERSEAISTAFAAYRLAATQIAHLEGDGEAGAATAHAYYHSQILPLYATLTDLLNRHATEVENGLNARIESIERAQRWSGRLGLAGAFLVLLTALFAGILGARYVGKGLERSVLAARAIAAGRITNPVRVASEDEFGDLSEAFNEMVARLSTATLSKTYVENIVQSMADPLVVVDPDVRIAMVNQALLDLLGYEQDELTGASVTRIFAHTGRQRGAAIKQDIERGLSGNVDSMFRTKAGQEVMVSVSSALVRAGGEVQGLVIVAKDITEQKRRENELIVAKEEAERMVQLRDAFLANMSHEIRTPLTGILGSAQVLAEVVEGEHRNLARIIEDAGNRLLDTINSVLEMARIEAGEVQPEMEILDFVQEAEAVASVLRPLAEKKGLVLRVYPPPAGGRVAAQLDRTCLNRILNNLIGNAIKFTKEGGVSIEMTADGDDAVLTVRDTGIGIGKEFIPFLFDDFKQESTGVGRNHEGSGLGLAITKKLVDMMGGTIAVESVKGLGSAFTARFERVPLEEAAAYLPPEVPAIQAPVATTATTVVDEEPWEAPGQAFTPTFEAPPAAGNRPVRDLLLIEDNQQNAYMARFMLDGYAADVATTPEEALELARRYQYSVLLVDINLGTDSSGIDLLHEFRKLDGYDTTPAVAVTAYALPGDRERFLTEGFNDYVSKPYRKETLREAVERAVATARPSEPVADLDVVLGGSFDEPADGEPEAPVAAVPAATPPSPTAFAIPTGDPEDAPDVEIASPEEFLPADYYPARPAFSAEAAAIVERAEERARPPVEEPVDVSELSDDSVFFVDFNPPSPAGDGAGRPPNPSGG